MARSARINAKSRSINRVTSRIEEALAWYHVERHISGGLEVHVPTRIHDRARHDFGYRGVKRNTPTTRGVLLYLLH